MLVKKPRGQKPSRMSSSGRVSPPKKKVASSSLTASSGSVDTSMGMSTKAKIKVKGKRSWRKIGAFFLVWLIVSIVYYYRDPSPISSILFGWLVAVFLFFILKYVWKIVLTFLLALPIGFALVYLLEMAGANFGDYGTSDVIALFSVNVVEALGACVGYAIFVLIIFYFIRAMTT
jgi:hypothetical protein